MDFTSVSKAFLHLSYICLYISYVGAHRIGLVIHLNVFSRTPDLGYDFDTNSGRAFNYFSYGVAVSEVEIDCLTGSHKVMPT